jgi:hypothetical protein
MTEPQETPSRCPTYRCPTMVLTQGRRRFHRSLYFTLFGISEVVCRAWEELPMDKRQVPFSVHVAIQGLCQWLAAHPTRESLP